MSRSHSNNERKMRSRIKQRLVTMQFLRRNVRQPRLLGENRRAAQRAFEAADTDDCIFGELFEEPLPVHWRNTLRLETDLWVAIVTTLESWQREPADVQSQAGAVRAELDRIERLLNLELQMLTSPLSRHFQKAIEAFP